METGPDSRARGALAILGDVIVAPRAAFLALRVRPHWGWAVFVTCALSVLGTVLMMPANLHVARILIEQNPTHNPAFSALSPDRRAAVAASVMTAQRAVPFLAPIGVAIAVLYGACVFAIARAIGGGEASFAKLFALAANVGFVRLGLQAIVTGAIIAVRGPLAFSTAHDLVVALPSLAWLVPPGDPKLAALLSIVNPFQIWTFVLATIGLEIVAGVRRPVALGAAAVLILAEALAVTAGAR